MSLDIRKKLEEELQAIQRELAVELPREIQKARAHGDLSENAEYHAAKERQRLLQARVGQLTQRLSDLSMINMSKIPKDRISLGSTVVLLDVDKSEEVTYRLVTSEESNAAEGAISTTSPIGRSLIGKREGDQVEVRIPAGIRTFEILSFTTIHSE